MNHNARRALRCILLSAAMVLSGCATTPDTKSRVEQEVRDAQATLADFQHDPEMAWFRSRIKDARAVIISPRITRAGFVLGGAGGRGVVLARDGKTARWTGPAFYTIGAGSVGLQIGVDVSEVVMLVMTDKGLNALLSPKFSVGADVSVAAGPVGVGTASSVTEDLVSFARARGAYAGLSFSGAVITPDGDANQAYYGSAASPVDILVRKNVDNPSSDLLRQSLSGMVR